MILEDGSYEALKASLFWHLTRHARYVLETIADRGVFAALASRANRESGEIWLTFRVRRSMSKISAMLHLETYRLNYPVPYELNVRIYGVDGYEDESPFEWSIQRGPPVLGDKAHCFRRRFEAGRAGVRAAADACPARRRGG